MDLGFTGTQAGMSPHQRIQVLALLILYRTAPYYFSRFHHGDCLGADAQAHRLARALGYAIILHPPTDRKKRAFLQADCDEVREAKPYLERNQEIVDESLRLIATPKEAYEVLRSGTWSTIRRAQQKRIPIDIIAPHE